MSEQVEVIIIGGGASGLSAALILGRSKRNVLVLDSDEARNKVTHASHGYLTRDGVKPEEFKAIGLQEIEAYPNVHYVRTRVTDLTKENGVFYVQTVNGKSYTSKRVVVATGMKDNLPNINGLEDVYGTSVFPCPYCDGWERKDEPLAIFGNDPMLLHYIKLIYNWSQDLKVFTNGPADLSSADRDDLKRHAVELVEEPIEQLVSTDGQLQQIVLKSDVSYDRSGGFIMDTGERQAFSLPDSFNIEFTEMGGYHTEEESTTQVKGLYVIGDSKHVFSGLLKAASEGYELGAMLNHEMAMEDWEQES